MESDGADSAQEQPFSTTSDAGGLFLAPGAESVADFDTGAAANLVCFPFLDTVAAVWRGKVIRRRRPVRRLRYPVLEIAALVMRATGQILL